MFSPSSIKDCIYNLGWGAQDIEGNEYNPILQYADMNFISFGECMELYYGFQFQNASYNRETGMCLMGNNEETICRYFIL